MEHNKRTAVIIEARMTSTRLPGKVLFESCGKPLLQHMIERIRRSKLIDDVIVATTINSTDDPIVETCKKVSCNYFRGSENDVLLRVLEAAKYYSVDTIVETTGDCPCIDWRHIDYLLEKYEENRYDFVSNVSKRTFPDGFDIRIFSTDSLDEVNSLTTDPSDHEHVAIYYPRHPERYKMYNWEAPEEEHRPDLEITLDEQGDYMLINSVFENLYYNNNDFSCLDVIRYLDKNPRVLEFVRDIKRKAIG